MLTLYAPPMTGDELLIVNAARVSLSKHHTRLSESDPPLIRFLYQHSHWTPFGHPQIALRIESGKLNVERLLCQQTPGSEILHVPYLGYIIRGSLWYWIQNMHLFDNLTHDTHNLFPIIGNLIWDRAPHVAQAASIPDNRTSLPSAREFHINDEWVAQDAKRRAKLAWMTVVVKAPLPNRTQLFKHKFGFVENEESRRYIDTEPTVFNPVVWRARAPNVKQGSLKEPISANWLARLIAAATYSVSKLGYKAILQLGGCPEQARFLLPQGMVTQWYWTGSLDAISRVIALRTDEHTQEETCHLANQLQELVSERWPLTAKKMWSTSLLNTAQNSRKTSGDCGA